MHFSLLRYLSLSLNDCTSVMKLWAIYAKKKNVRTIMILYCKSLWIKILSTLAGNGIHGYSYNYYATTEASKSASSLSFYDKKMKILIFACLSLIHSIGALY